MPNCPFSYLGAKLSFCLLSTKLSGAKSYYHPSNHILCQTMVKRSNMSLCMDSVGSGFEICSLLIIQESFEPIKRELVAINILLIIFWGQTIVEITNKAYVCGPVFR